MLTFLCTRIKLQITVSVAELACLPFQHTMSTAPVLPRLLGSLTTGISWRVTALHHISWVGGDIHGTTVIDAPSVQTRDCGFILCQQRKKGLQAEGRGGLSHSTDLHTPGGGGFDAEHIFPIISHSRFLLWQCPCYKCCPWLSHQG